MTFGLGMELAWDRPGVGTGRWAALLALAFVAFAPGAVQQGHFYIVDGFFTAIALAGLWVIVRAVQGGGWHWFVLAGLFVGALGAVRFNGLALGVVLLAGHLARPGEGVLRRLRAAEQWVGRRGRRWRWYWLYSPICGSIPFCWVWIRTPISRWRYALPV